MKQTFPVSPRIRARIIPAAGIAVALCVGTLPLAADPPQREPESAPLTVEGAADKSDKQCEWACQKWTKLCNVDPRGVYKCRRSCAKFGEVCE